MDSMYSPDEKTLEEKPIVCRTRLPILVSIILMVLLSCMGLVNEWIDPSPTTEGRYFIWTSSGIFFSIFLIWAYRLVRYCVIADREGIRWRGLLYGWRFAPWSAVSDYYQDQRSLTEGSEVTRILTVVTSIGDLCVSSTGTNYIPFQEYVQKRAVNARVGEWERKGTRPIDAWPRTFCYWNSIWVPRLTAMLLGLMIAAVFVVRAALSFVHSLVNTIGWEQTRPVIYALIIAGTFAVGVCVLFYGRYGIAYRRRGERFTVSPESLTYENAATGESLTIPWTDVVDYHYMERGDGFRHRYYTLVLHGVEERQLSWSLRLPQSDLLVAIVQRYAPRSPHAEVEQEGWRAKSKHEQTGGSDPATWKSGAIGMGDRVFVYGTPSNIAFFAVLLLMASTTIGVVLDVKHKSTQPPLWLLLGFMAVFGAPPIWGLICCFRSRVEVDSMGITQYTPLGKKHLYWYAVETYKREGTTTPRQNSGTAMYSMEIKGRDGTRIVVWDNIRSYVEFCQEVRRLAPPAAEVILQQPAKEIVHR